MRNVQLTERSDPRRLHVLTQGVVSIVPITQPSRRAMLRGSLAVAGLGVLRVPDWVLQALAQGRSEERRVGKECRL